MFEPNCVIVVVAPEISLKSNKVQKRIHSILKKNIASYLEKENISLGVISFGSGRLFVETNKTKEAIVSLKNCFGIHLLIESQKEQTNSTEEIIEKGLEISSGKIKESFAVRCKSFNNKIKSKQIEIELGSKILENNKKTKVNLGAPKTQLNIIVFDKKSFFYFDSVLGAEGMPVGSQGNVALIGKNKNKLKQLAISLLKTGCRIKLIKSENKIVLDLEKYNNSKELESISVEDAREMLANNRINGIFCDALNLEEKKEFDSLIGEKTFAPLILLV